MKLKDAIAMFAEAALDAILPPRERSVRLRARGAAELPLSPSSHELEGVHITTLMDYRARPVEDAIRALKYDGDARAAALLAAALADFLREEVASARAFSLRKILLVPVPLHRARRRERGFNQIECVLARLPVEFKDGTLAQVELKALARTRATPAQTKLSRRERLRNVRGAFTAEPALVAGAHVYVIDDVTTTGATLAACAGALEQAGAQATAIALARA